MKRYNFSRLFDILIPKKGEYYADTLIDHLRQEINEGWKGLGLGRFTIQGAFNDWFTYRVVNKKRS